MAIAPQQADKCGSEGAIEYCIDDGVDGGGDVAEPEANINHMAGHSVPRVYRHNNIEDEEWWPAQDECEKDDAQDLVSGRE